MLRELHIRNFAVIEDQAVSFWPGLNVMTGETGAGKSIVLEALRLILGGRARSDFVRAGAETLEVQALLDVSAVSPKLLAELPDIIRDAAQAELLISREVGKAGKSRVYINGRLSSVGVLEEVSSKLISICSQNQQLMLLDARYHLGLIDDFAGHAELVEQYTARYREWRELDERINAAQREREVTLLREAELRALVEELESAEVRPGMRQELENEVRRLGNSESIAAESAAVDEVLNGEDGIYQQLAALGQRLHALVKLDPSLATALEQYEGINVLVGEFERRLQQCVAALEVDSNDLQKLRDTLAEIARLERKYRVNDQGLCALLEQAKGELGRLSDGANIERLRQDAEARRRELLQLGAELRKGREKSGASLSKLVRRELSELNMECRLELRLEPLPAGEVGPSGLDRAELLIATNPGEPPKPLKQIASGGELSRIMLVLKKVLRDRSGVNVLVFDEVDTGISGGVARAVGEKLRQLAQSSQVLCITHLPQVASLADHHVLVEKEVGKRAVTKIRALSETERVEEIARMLAGYKVTGAARESAMELLTSKNVSQNR